MQLLVEDHIVERDREPAAEHLHQRAVGWGQRTRRLQYHDNLAAGRGPQVEHESLGWNSMRAALESALDCLPQGVTELFGPAIPAKWL